MSLVAIILIVVLVLALAGGAWGIGGQPWYGVNPYWSGGGLGLVLVVLLVLALIGRI